MENAHLIIDFVFLLFVAICVFDGRKKGFVKMILSFAATIVSWLIAYELSEPIAVWANESFVHGWISDSIENAIAGSIGNGTDALLESIPNYIANVAQTAGISLNEIALQLGNSVDSAQAAEKIYAALDASAIVPILKIIAFFVVYAIVEWVLALGIGVINKICKLPIIKGFNKLLGGLAGALKGIIICAVVSLVLSIFVMLSPESQLALAVGKSTVYQVISEALALIFT